MRVALRHLDMKAARAKRMKATCDYCGKEKPLDPADEWTTGSVEDFLEPAAESGARVDELS